MTLYLILLISSLVVPLALSFDKKLKFYRQWKYLFPSIFIIAAVYISFDIVLTHHGVWGFNPRYHLNFLIFGLPIEEWLFFIVIPYCSIFLHDAFVLYFPQIKISTNSSRFISIAIIVLLINLVVQNSDKTYTVYIFLTFAIALVWSLFEKTRLINRFYITFLLILIPFVIVNAILTGSFIEEEVVWYNNNENLGFRFFTIPIEDFGYAFSMILLNLQLREKLKTILSKIQL
jgi:lycopene cyclase domain-containing protein